MYDVARRSQGTGRRVRDRERTTIRGRARRYLCARAGGDSGRNLVCGARFLEVQKEVGQGESGLGSFDFVACSCGGGLCVLNTDWVCVSKLVGGAWEGVIRWK